MLLALVMEVQLGIKTLQVMVQRLNPIPALVLIKLVTPIIQIASLPLNKEMTAVQLKQQNA